MKKKVLPLYFNILDSQLSRTANEISKIILCFQSTQKLSEECIVMSILFGFVEIYIFIYMCVWVQLCVWTFA